MLPDIPPSEPSAQRLCVEQLPVKAEAKKMLSTSAFFLSVVTSLPVLLTRRVHTPGLPFPVDVPTEAFFVPLAKSLSSLEALLHSPQSSCPCFHCLCIFFLLSKFDQQALFSHASFLPSFPDFLHLGMENFCAPGKFP